LKKALLIIDRGSREPEVREELEGISSIAKTKGGYYYVNYCFLEVLPPFIEEGIKKCQENGVDVITVIPYFLYPGMKLKDSVRQSARICKIQKLNLVIAKPLSYHPMMTQLVIDRNNRRIFAIQILNVIFFLWVMAVVIKMRELLLNIPSIPGIYQV
jgi:sirohydrochlorin ferrochelatase